MIFVSWIVLLSSILSLAYCGNITSSKDLLFLNKSKSIFQFIRFPNDVCNGNSEYNGTCYSADECSSRGGSNIGSCASGFGTCCAFTLSCGKSSSENCTYLVQGSTSGLSSSCIYTICSAKTSICRIRFDFTNFQLAGPVTAPVGTLNVGTGIGDCQTDTFMISNPGGKGSPIICGLNTNQHMFIDASAACNSVVFNIGQGSTVSRSWNIKVTQYACGDDALSGPSNCLQYFTGVTGVISSYNFDTSASTVSPTATHLSNQCYTICVRRESKYCYICYDTNIQNASPNSFGLSFSPNAGTPLGGTNTNCPSDYLSIPGAVSAVQVQSLATNLAAPRTFKICGRFFTTINNGPAPTSVCTRQTPFMIIFKTNSDESTLVGASDQNNNELAGAPSGVLGFSIRYRQTAC